jgi:hypothetical protein
MTSNNLKINKYFKPVVVIQGLHFTQQKKKISLYKSTLMMLCALMSARALAAGSINSVSRWICLQENVT